LVFWIINSEGLRWAAHVMLMEEERNAFKLFAGNLRGIDWLGDQGENNIKMYLQGII
jgi:hypothetical protein